MRSADDDGDDEVLAPDSVLDSDLEVEDEFDEDLVDDGFGDPDRIVRLWFEGDDLTRVRISSSWRSKLAGRSLDECFAAAIMMANMRVAEVKPRPTPRFDGVDFAQLPPVSARSVAAFQVLFDGMHARWDEALERRAQRPAAESGARTGRSKGVVVELSATGRLSRVSLDQQWLAGVEAPVIRSHVMRAWRQARAGLVPVGDDQAELIGLETEHQLLVTAFEAMLNPGRGVS
ncbi:hypothetical protein [Tessaracoccus antarcticus]|uniref:hypothetical protein n=1 Tax=Tessaracoccus antarcticus TaxID=2479848 RepID=UPI0011C48B46|nr:hypothetical protein [Tessaracoccus antarcticus]